MQNADFLIEPQWVLPIAPNNTALTNHAVAVAAGTIVAVGPVEQLRARFADSERIVRPTHALLPGLVNAHVRAGGRLLRGLPVRGPRARWLRETLLPAEQRWMSAEFVREGTRLAAAEMLQAGITCFADASLFPEEGARIAATAGIRAAIGLPVADGSNAWAADTTAHLARGERVWDEYRAHPWVQPYFAPQAGADLSDATLVRVRRVADELDARVAMSVHETDLEIRDSLAQHGRRPLQRLQALGLLQSGFTAIHMNRLDASDLEIAAATGVAVVTCPQANLRLGSGCSVARLSAAGLVCGLGSAEPAACGALDILSEARMAALIGANEPDGQALSAFSALRMATLDGAAALGLEARIGSLEPGKAADLVCVDIGSLACQPDALAADA
ncbi:MAG TPA: amidohydrolase family protein, partial [Candidatus Dormibacteraeota bacterium]|nr:amidohydrolase family protein [Candidatus Dormibacteraeota bacterium]